MLSEARVAAAAGAAVVVVAGGNRVDAAPSAAEAPRAAAHARGRPGWSTPGVSGCAQAPLARVERRSRST